MKQVKKQLLNQPDGMLISIPKERFEASDDIKKQFRESISGEYKVKEKPPGGG